MKFAKQLDEAAVPEWRDRYLDYRQAKKKLKLLGRAVRNTERDALTAAITTTITTGRPGPRQNVSPLRISTSARADPWITNTATASNAAQLFSNERSPLRMHGAIGGRSDQAITSEGDADGRPGMARYGSIIGSPPKEPVSLLELPDPAIQEAEYREREVARQADLALWNTATSSLRNLALQRSHTASDMLPSLHQQEQQTSDDRTPSKGDWPSKSPLKPNVKRMNSVPITSWPGYLRHFGTWRRSGSISQHQPQYGDSDVALEAYDEVDSRRSEFFLFLDASLATIEDFYRAKENEATERLKVLRQQLHILRRHRAAEINAAAMRKQRRQNSNRADGQLAKNDNKRADGDSHRHNHQNQHHNGYRYGLGVPKLLKDSVVSQVEHALARIHARPEGQTSRAMRHLASPSLRVDEPDAPRCSIAIDRNHNQQHVGDGPANNGNHVAHRDYERRQGPPQGPSYREAKHKLKVALAEFYRGLELLKGYALLNRTAFRKINKKYDKTMHTKRPTLRYLTEKVDVAYFTKSDVVDEYMQTVEDLYARYFEQGNRKVAVGKLRAKVVNVGQYSGNMFRTGLFFAAGIVLAILGLVQGVTTDLNDPNPIFREWAAYLLQIYAGYFLLLVLVIFFCIDARSFTYAKVNYTFIFEFDTRSNLNWRQLSEIPAVFTFLLGLVMYLNFQRVGGVDMYTYWPVVLIGLSASLLFLPAPLFYHKSRRWFAYSMQRLLFSGAYPVEFRDFFLGDMFCSLTYAMGNIELFFCLYANGWDKPSQCNSSHSRLFGFLQTWPGIWRALQCIRRYNDTRDIYPHLFNCAKYGFTILSYMSLSLFRIDRTDRSLALFTFFSMINSCVVIFWDIVNDWSLGKVHSKNKFLRDILVYNPPSYYAAIVFDAIIRCNWVFYIIFRNDLQHSSIVSFLIALTEVVRRGVWTVFRVENEHVANVRRRRAARDDVPVPYEMLVRSRTDQTDGPRGEDHDRVDGGRGGTGSAGIDHNDEEERVGQYAGARPADLLDDLQQNSSIPAVTRALRRAGGAIFTAHVQDYQRRSPNVMHQSADSDDEEEDDDDDDNDDDIEEHDNDDDIEEHDNDEYDAQQRRST